MKKYIFTGSPLVIAVVAIAALVFVSHQQQREAQRAQTQFSALIARNATAATPIYADTKHGRAAKYSCTSKNGFIYHAPTRADLVSVCE